MALDKQARAAKYYEKNKERIKASVKLYRQKNKQTVNARERGYHYKSSYGLTIEQRDELIKSQNGLCAICQKSGELVVDHNHNTGKVRGMLHRTCNAALGLFEDSSLVLLAAAKYLETTNGFN
jgi:hypothetical protein